MYHNIDLTAQRYRCTQRKTTVLLGLSETTWERRDLRVSFHFDLFDYGRHSKSLSLLTASSSPSITMVSHKLVAYSLWDYRFVHRLVQHLHSPKTAKKATGNAKLIEKLHPAWAFPASGSSVA